MLLFTITFNVTSCCYRWTTSSRLCPGTLPSVLQQAPRMMCLPLRSSDKWTKGPDRFVCLIETLSCWHNQFQSFWQKLFMQLRLFPQRCEIFFLRRFLFCVRWMYYEMHSLGTIVYIVYMCILAEFYSVAYCQSLNKNKAALFPNLFYKHFRYSIVLC